MKFVLDVVHEDDKLIYILNHQFKMKIIKDYFHYIDFNK